MGANFVADITMTTFQPDPAYTTGALGAVAGIIASLLAFSKSNGNGDSNGTSKKNDEEKKDAND